MTILQTFDTPPRSGDIVNKRFSGRSNLYPPYRGGKPEGQGEEEECRMLNDEASKEEEMVPV